MNTKVSTPASYADSDTPVIRDTTDDVVVGGDKPAAAGAVIPEEGEIPYSEKNNAYVNISEDITSRFVFYPFSTLSIKPFDIACLRKIFRGVSLQRTDLIVEVISSTIDPDKSALNLTHDDFWALMLWQRINSYKKSPYYVEFDCDNPKHITGVAKGEYTPESLHQKHHIQRMGQLQLVWVDDVAIAEHVNRVVKEYGVSLYPTTMRDIIEMEKIISALPEGESPEGEWLWIAKLASNISPKHGRSIQQRIDFLSKEGTSPDLLQEIQTFQDLCQHGVKEINKIKCEVCNAEKEVELSFNALSFFPGNQ